MFLKRGSPLRTGGLKKTVLIFLTTILVLSFFGFMGEGSSALAATVNLSGFEFKPDVDNKLTYNQAKSIAGFKCDYTERPLDLNSSTNTVDFTCTWNKILLSKSAVSYSLKYLMAERDPDSRVLAYTIKSDGPYKNDDVSGNTITTRSLSTAYLQESGNTFPNQILDKMELIVNFRDSLNQPLPVDATIGEIATEYFNKGGSFTFEIDSDGKINLPASDPNNQTNTPRPAMKFSLAYYVQQGSGFAETINAFYFKSDSLDNLYIRVVHSFASSVIVPGADVNACYENKREYAPMFTEKDGLRPMSLPVTQGVTPTITAKLGDSFWENFFFKFYKEDNLPNDTLKGKNCPRADTIDIATIEAVGAAESSTSNPIGGAGDVGGISTGSTNGLYNEKEKTCTGDSFDGKKIGSLISPIQGMACWALSGPLNGLEKIFNWIRTGSSEPPKDETGQEIKGLEGQLIINEYDANGNYASGFADNPTVRTVWGTVRDFINSLFLVAFLFSILVTALKLESAANLASWQMKKMIPSIVTALILVNFSLSIANFVILIMDALTRTFLEYASASGGITSNAFVGMFSVANTTILGVILKIIFGFAMVAITGYLTLLVWIRRYIILFLFMAASIPYLGSIIPVDAVKKSTSFWWNTFFSWSLMGPMVAFFLYVAAVATQAATSADINKLAGSANLVSGTSGKEGIGIDLTSIILVILTYYLAATIPLKLGGDIMNKVKGIATGKDFKGKAAGPVSELRKKISTRSMARVSKVGEAAKGGFIKYASKATPGGAKAIEAAGGKVTLGQKMANKAINVWEAPTRALGAEKKKVEQAGKLRDKQNYIEMGKYDTTDTTKIEEDAKKFDGSTADYTFQSSLTAGNPNTRLSAMEKHRRVAMGIDPAANDAEKAKHTEMWNYHKEQMKKQGIDMSDTEIVGGPNNENVQKLRNVVLKNKTIDKRMGDIGKFGGDKDVGEFLKGVEDFDVKMMGKNALTVGTENKAYFDEIFDKQVAGAAPGTDGYKANEIVIRARAIRGGDVSKYIKGLLDDAGGDETTRKKVLENIRKDFADNMDMSKISGPELLERVRGMGPQFKGVKSEHDAKIIREQLEDVWKLYNKKDQVAINKVNNAAL